MADLPSSGPIDPRLLRRARATRTYLVAGVAVGSTTAILTLVQAWLLSHSVADVFATGALASLPSALLGLALVFAGKGLLAWANPWLAHRAAAAVKSQLRRDIMTARLRRPIDSPTSTGGVVTLVTQGLDALDGYYAKYLPQLVLAVTVPLIVGAAILSADLTSAIIVALTLPLIPVFMALVGWTTEARTRRRWAIQTRLAHHFADLVMGLPTLQVFGRARAQAEGLRRTEAAHRRETMGTLRISFLSALVLELLATLSVALVAVTVGFRVVYGDLDLATALFVLILAPEAYLPVRQVGVHYHDAADGMAAAEAAFKLIDSGTGEDTSPRGETPPAVVPEEPPPGASRWAVRPLAGPLISVRDLGHRYPGASRDAVAGVTFDLAPGEIVVLTGVSGGGKTTVLNAIIGFLSPTAGQLLVEGRPLLRTDLARWRTRLAYVGQNPGMVSGTVADNVRLGDPGATEAQVREALNGAGAPEIGLDRPLGDDGEGLSAGERRRVAMARALVRMRHAGGQLLLLDEPTAGLDADAEAALLRGLRDLGASALVVSHRPAVIAAADRVVPIGARPDPPASGEPRTQEDSLPGSAGSPAGQPDDPVAPGALAPASGRISGQGSAGEVLGPVPSDSTAPARSDSPLRRLLATVVEAVPGARGRLALALLLAFAASAASVALMVVSAWLLSRAAEHPPVLYLQVAAVGVRFFGISRGVFRYLERLVGHDIALRMQSALRIETYAKLARTTLLGRRRGDLLTRVIADVEAVQDLVVRVWLPFASSALVIAATTAGLAFFSPGSAGVLLVSSVVAALLVPALAQRASETADRAAVPLRGRLADAVHEVARTAPDLVAYGADADRLGLLAGVDADLRRAEARASWVRGVAAGAQVLAAGLAVTAALAIGGRQVADGTLAPVMLAVLVLTPLALHEAMGTLTQAAQTNTRARAALERVHAVIDAEPIGSGDVPLGEQAVPDPHLRLTGVSAGWPGAGPLVTGFDLGVSAGEKVALVGPSGVGKTTLAATILGLIPALSGEIEVRGRPGYLAQDAHIFSTTVAENVRLGNRDADDSDVALALARAGLDLPPNRLVGETGSALSGGEARRVALARLLVGEHQVLILDEPSEHLDAATAAALLDDIWATTSDKAVLVITHDPAVVQRCHRSVVLG